MDDDLGRQLVEMMTAATWHNKTGRSLCAQCGVWFLDLNEYFKHISRHTHPSAGGGRG